MTPTYTREQLEALRDCASKAYCTGCVFDETYKCVKPRCAEKYLAADLLTALNEIERLRTALEPLAICSDLVWMNSGPEKCIENGREEKDWCDGCKARKVLDETNKGETHEA